MTPRQLLIETFTQGTVCLMLSFILKLVECHNQLYKLSLFTIKKPSGRIFMKLLGSFHWIHTNGTYITPLEYVNVI